MSARPLCHICGADIERDEPILIDQYSMRGDGWPLNYLNVPIRQTAGENTLCWTMMKAYPDFVSRTVLMERLGSDSDGNIIEVMICRIRARMRTLGLPVAIETVRGKGYRWLGECTAAIAEDVFEHLTIANIRQAFSAPGDEL